MLCFFFFNDTATTEIYTLSLHDALPICGAAPARLRDRHRDKWNDPAAAEDRLDLRQSESERGVVPLVGQRAEADLSAIGRRAGTLREPRFHALLLAADGWAPARAQHPARAALLPGAPEVAAEPADAEDSRDPMTGRRVVTYADHDPVARLLPVSVPV